MFVDRIGAIARGALWAAVALSAPVARAQVPAPNAAAVAKAPSPPKASEGVAAAPRPPAAAPSSPAAAPTASSPARSLRPVTPHPSPEAARLYDFLQGISGQHTLAGQHCAPLVESSRLVVIARSMQRYPALFGQDFGFDAGGMWDGINFRQRVVDEAIRRHAEGFVISLMWHAVRPTEDEPVTFERSIQGELSDAEWQELITPGTHLNERWKSQVDVIAWFLKQLRAAHVPVIWRPYHEMNGGWFWWGKKRGPDGYRKLYRMLFERFVNFHGLDNLLWVYNANERRPGVDPYADYYPGADVVDILATDVYQGGYASQDYRELSRLARGKPIALGEVGQPPPLAILEQQPRWAWFMLWGDLPPRWQGGADFGPIYRSERALTLDELPWARVKQPALHYPILQ